MLGLSQSVISIFCKGVIKNRLKQGNTRIPALGVEGNAPV